MPTKLQAANQRFENQDTFVAALVFVLLVGIGVVGRLGQPVWGFTPIAAAALFAGAYFSHRGIAALVPALTLLVTDLFLDGHDNLGVMLSVYVAMALPALAGRWLRPDRNGSRNPKRWLATLAAGSVIPATLFFVVTNFAVWWFRSDYAADFGGLMACYTNALPFYRQMLAGDLLYVPLLFGGAALAGVEFAPKTVLSADRA